MDIVERLKEIAYRDTATTISVNANDLRKLISRVETQERALRDIHEKGMKTGYGRIALARVAAAAIRTLKQPEEGDGG